MKLDDFKSGKGETAWNNVLREFDGFLGVAPTKATVNGNTITIAFPDHVAALSPTPIDLGIKIPAGR
jgi:hypothetical protein